MLHIASGATDCNGAPFRRAMKQMAATGVIPEAEYMRDFLCSINPQLRRFPAWLE